MDNLTDKQNNKRILLAVCLGMIIAGAGTLIITFFQEPRIIFGIGSAVGAIASYIYTYRFPKE